jgi:large subunit ribosomal protein L4
MEEKVQEKQKSRAMRQKELGVAAQDFKNVDNLFAIWVHSLLQNWRQGTVSCKGRSDVAYSGKKPWKQKGTGRARAGTARSPLWRGGGVIFGPSHRVRALNVPKQFKKNVMQAIFADLVKHGKIIQLDWNFEGEKPKTSVMIDVLKNAKLLDKKLVMLVSIDDVATQMMLANIPYISVLSFDQLNAFDLVNCDYVVIFKKDINQFKEAVSRWT